MAVDIGAEAIVRFENLASGWTFINKDKPASGAGEIISIDIWAGTNITGLRVGTFYVISGDTLKCRDSVIIAGTILAGSKVSKAVSISVEVGDYIGLYYTAGNVRRDQSGYAGLWILNTEKIDPGDQGNYTFLDGDACSLGGYISVAHEKALSDTITIADIISKEPGLIKSDSLAISDSLIKAIGLIKSDTLNITEAIVKAIGLFKADTITISDSVVDVSEFYLAIADTVAIVDTISKEPGLFESDTIAIADSLTKDVGLNKADSITIAESIIKAMSIPQADTVIISDSISKDFGLIKSDTITISDVFSKVSAYFRSLSDTILITDSISKTWNIKIILSDIITIADQAKLLYPVRRAVAIGRMAIKRITSARLPYKKIHEEDV